MIASLLTLLANAPANGAPPAGGGGAGGGGGGGFGMGWEQLLLFFVAPLLLLWLFVLRPQQRQAREQREQLSKIKKNDEVITAGGIIGTVVNVKEKAGGIAGEEDVITISLDGKTRMQVIRSSIAKVLRPDEGKKEAEATGNK
jgi:preprotein translocase subunit YajC